MGAAVPILLCLPRALVSLGAHWAHYARQHTVQPVLSQIANIIIKQVHNYQGWAPPFFPTPLIANPLVTKNIPMSASPLIVDHRKSRESASQY
jgi:hypothetical protein